MQRPSRLRQNVKLVWAAGDFASLVDMAADSKNTGRGTSS
jgi:hypothetical protein